MAKTNKTETRRPSTEEVKETTKTVMNKLTTETRLLETVFSASGEESLLKAIEHARETMPAHEEMEADNIVDLFSKLGRNFTPMEEVTVGDLTSLGRKYAQKFICGTVFASVQDHGHYFSWKSTEKYAPSIIMEADNTLRLRYGKFGDISTIVNYTDADDVLPHLPFDPAGNDFDCVIAWGIASEKDGDWRFRAKPLSDATDLLLAVPWGGAHSNTNGRKRDELFFKHNPEIRFFEKQSSKSGGEGIDYYVIKLIPGDLQDAVAVTEARLMDEDHEAELYFYAKYLQIKVLKQMCDDIEEKMQEEIKELECLYGDIDDQVEALCKKYKDAHIFSAPKRESIPNGISREYSYKMSIGELTSYAEKQLLDAEVEFVRALEKNKLMARSYANLVPKYAQLASCVYNKCRGRMEILSDGVILCLPSTEEGGHKFVKHSFGFTESQLGLCIELIYNFIDTEKNNAEGNAKLLKQLCENKK